MLIRHNRLQDRFVAMAREQGCTTEQNPRVTTLDAAKMLEPDIVFYFGFGHTVETDITMVNPTAPCYIGRSKHPVQGSALHSAEQRKINKYQERANHKGRHFLPLGFEHTWKQRRRSTQTAPATGSAHEARHRLGSQRYDYGPSSYVGQRQRPLRPDSGRTSQTSRGQEKRRRTAAPLTPRPPCSCPAPPASPFSSSISLPSPFPSCLPLLRALSAVDSSLWTISSARGTI